MDAAVLAITRGGLAVGRRIKKLRPNWSLHAPRKLDDGGEAEWFDEPASLKVGELFRSRPALVCVFSLGAVIRLVAPHLADKKTDPAVLVIDDAAGFVISALSGHLGGANALASELASGLGAQAVVTTAADVNKTIAVDLVGRELGWTIEPDSQVTAVSACMVNGEPVGVFQDSGPASWRPSPMPANVSTYGTHEELEASGSKARMVISDRVRESAAPCVTYRPPSLVAGVGVHAGTSSDKIISGIRESCADAGLSPLSVGLLASVKKPQEVAGLAEAAGRMGARIKYIERSELAGVSVPNPSGVVERLEGTPSVSEAAAISASGGRLAVQKRKFPPDLTVAIARVPA